MTTIHITASCPEFGRDDLFLTLFWLQIDVEAGCPATTILIDAGFDASTIGQFNSDVGVKFISFADIVLFRNGMLHSIPILVHIRPVVPATRQPSCRTRTVCGDLKDLDSVSRRTQRRKIW